MRGTRQEVRQNIRCLPQGATMLPSSQDGTALLIINGATGSIVRRIDNVGEYALHKKSSQLAYTTVPPGKHCVTLLDLKKEPVETALDHSGSGRPSGLVWQEGGQSLAYYNLGVDEKANIAGEICLYQIQKKKTMSYYIREKDSLSCLKYVQSLTISDDASNVFITTFQPEGTAIRGPSPEVWNGNDKWLYPLAYYMDQELRLKHYVWKPESVPKPINDIALPAMRLIGDALQSFENELPGGCHGTGFGAVS